MRKNLIFLGPPGCGKGTQSTVLSLIPGYIKLSTGDLFRNIAKQGNELGEKIKSILAQGNLVNDDLVNKTIDDFYSKVPQNKIIVLDGYPRSVIQAEELDRILNKYKAEVNEVFYFDVSDEVLIKRITGRFTCKDCNRIYNKFFYTTKILGQCDQCGGKDFNRRDDDSREVLVNRLDVFRKTTRPLLEYYDKKLININADKSAHEVSEQIMKFLV